MVYQAPDYLGFAVRIEGPKNLRWGWTFREQEQSPKSIQEKVNQAIMAQVLLQEDSSA